ncbi:pentatricopeptide repeat-containing protein At1g62350-like isoform X1 [Salvia hispanica]|uniref:pentatricopeptide repeat-containing protein At1g62350-like isoform X1 n=1 Tax=Salvia hispanica TaxID=49212 RepID=UPI00200914CE|nr:pentatricopeptide repeat-containing protein At1g62350-like isoform X1 [Salvia hispanica]
MGSFSLQFSQLGLQQKPRISTFTLTLRIRCGGLRNGPRKPMWRTRVLSSETIQAVQSLKLAQKSPSKLEQVLTTKLGRLLKADLEDALAELQRQNELDLALKVFDFVKKETWYVPNLSLYNDMIRMVGKHRMIEMVEQFVVELQNEGLQPDARTYTELIGAYFKVEMVNKAMETYDQMKASGYVPDKLTLTILIRNLEKAGENALSEAIRKECAEYFDYPNKFLEEVERKHVTSDGRTRSSFTPPT